eukprot:gene30149-40041_t
MSATSRPETEPYSWPVSHGRGRLRTLAAEFGQRQLAVGRLHDPGSPVLTLDPGEGVTRVEKHCTVGGAERALACGRRPGVGVYCLTEPSFTRVMGHAVYVVIQTALEVLMAVRLGRTAMAGQELRNLVAAVDRPDGISLDAARAVHATTSSSRALQSTLMRMETAVAAVREATANLQRASAEIAQGNSDFAKSAKSGNQAAASLAAPKAGSAAPAAAATQPA